MSEIVSTSRLLVLSHKGIVDIWNISNLSSPVLVQAYIIDGADPATKLHDNLYAFKQSTKFLVTLNFSPNFSMQRFDYTLATPGIISVTKEFQNINGAGPEFMHINRKSGMDDHEDMIIAWTRDATSNPYDQRIYTFQRQCDYLKQNGAHPICYDCFSDQKITASGLANCMEISTVRFFTYKISKDTSKTDDLRNFYGILTLENFDINTNVVSNLQTWVQTNMVLGSIISAYSPSLTFEAVPANRTPTGDGKIGLPFKVTLSMDLMIDRIVPITFGSYSIINAPPTYMNIAQMLGQPQSLVLLTGAPSSCDPLTEVLEVSVCKQCGTDTQLSVTTAAVCNSQADIRFFTYKVTYDTTKVDDEQNFHGILTLENFNVNTNLISNFQTWLQTHMILTPNLSGNGPSVIFEPISSSRAPTVDNEIKLPFKIQLTTALASTQTVGITFNSYSLVQNNPTYFNLVQMITTPQSLALVVCNNQSQISHSGVCKNCDSESSIATNTAALCNSLTLRKFFTYKVTNDATKSDDSRKFHGVLTLENFDINTNQITTLKTWLQTNIRITPDLNANSPSIVFEDVTVNRAPTVDKKIGLPFRIDLGIALIGTQSLTTTFFINPIVNTATSQFNMVTMNVNPQTLAIVGCNPLSEVLNGGICKPCLTQTNLQATGPSICNSQVKVRFFSYSVVSNPTNNDPRTFYGTLTLSNFDVNTNELGTFQTWLETQMQFGVALSSFGPSVLFTTIPASRIPTGDGLISLPFKIQLTSDLNADTTASISFATSSIFSNYPNFFNMVQMNSTPQSLSLKACNPLIEAFHTSGNCKPCSTQAQLITSSATDCNSWGKIRFFTFTVTKTAGFDDLRNFQANLNLENFDVNTSDIPTLESWLLSNIQMTPNLSLLGPSISFINFPSSRVPTADKKISLPFKIQLTADLDADTSVEFTFTSQSIVSSYPWYLNIVEMTTLPSIVLSTNPVPVIQEYPYIWTIKGVQQKNQSTRILQTLQDNEHLVEFKIFSYNQTLDLIRDNISFFETELTLQFENPSDQGVSAIMKRVEWAPRQDSGDLYFNMKVVLSEPIINTRNQVAKIKVNLKNGSTDRITTSSAILYFPPKSESLIVELYPNKQLSKKTREYLDQKPDTVITRFSKSSTSKVIMVSLAAIGIVGSAGGACSLGFMNIGSAIIKLFIIIELIGKFLHLPIWYKGALLETLYTLSQFSDLVQLKPETFVKSSEQDQIRKSRYWTKFTVYEEYNNVLQAVPLSSIILISLIVIQGILQLVENTNGSCKKKKENCEDQEKQDLKTLIHGSGAFLKIKNFVGQFKLSLIESTFIDIVFASCYNLITDYRSSYPVSHIVGKTLAVTFLGLIIWRYIYVLETASCQPWKLTLYETKMLLENLDKESARKSILVRSMNIVFRLKIVFILACIVMLQNQLYACLIMLLLAQVGFFIKLIVGRKKHGKVFNGWIPFLNYILIEVTITLLVVICLALYSTQPKASQYEEEHKEVEVSSLESTANIVLVFLIIASILFEFFNLMKVILATIKKCLQKSQKKKQLEKAKTLVRLESMRLPSMKMPTMRLLTKTFTMKFDHTEQSPATIKEEDEPELSIERNIEAHQKEIEILEKDLVKKDKLEKIIDYWRHASVLTKVRKDLKLEAEKATTQIDQNSIKKKSEAKENQPSRLQNFLQRIDPEEPTDSKQERPFRARYFKKKKTSNQVNTATATRRQSKWHQVSEMVTDKKISQFAVNFLDSTKPTLNEGQADAKNSSEQENIKMTSCESKKIFLRNQEKKKTQLQLLGLTPINELPKGLQQDSFDSDSDSDSDSNSNSESENEKRQEKKADQVSGQDSPSRRGLLQSQKSIVVRSKNTYHDKQLTKQTSLYKNFKGKIEDVKLSKLELDSSEMLNQEPASKINITVNANPSSPFRKSKKKQTVVKFDDDQMNELERRDRLRVLNTEKKASGSKNSLGSSFGDDESQGKGQEFEESGIIIKNLVRVNTTVDIDYSIANSPSRRKKADDSVTNMGSIFSGKHPDNKKGIDFSKAVSVFEIDDSQEVSPVRKQKKHMALKVKEIPPGVSPVRENRLAMRLAEHRKFQNTPPIDKFDPSLFTKGSHHLEKDSGEFDQTQTMESPDRSTQRLSNLRNSTHLILNTSTNSSTRQNHDSPNKTKISIFGREKKTDNRRRRIASEALKYNEFDVIDEKSVEHQVPQKCINVLITRLQNF